MPMMAGSLKRRRGLIFKVIVGVPILWFSFIGFTVVISGGGGAFPADQGVAVGVRQVDAGGGGGGGDFGDSERNQPVAPAAGNGGSHLRNDDDDIKANMRRAAANNHNAVRTRKTFFPPLDNAHEANNNLEPPHPDDRHRFRNKMDSTTMLKVGPDVPDVNDDPNGPGAMGKAVIIDKKKLSGIERSKFDNGWHKNAFNQYASDMMSLHRSLPDIRDEECRSLRYPPNLPDTSVIICFHNEAWSVLMRTVHSVIDRSPKSLIKEIILVDDFSDMDHLKKPLRDYIEKLGKVKLVRTKKREGLIRARLLGASNAQGEVLTYLDSHCECTKGWLEPLLGRIAENKTHVVTPVIDVIDDETLRYQYSSAKTTSIGGFDWNLQFNWHSIPERERKRRSSDVAPVQSPTMAGGLFSISREYFETLGAYDPGMDIWGGENLELSFRIWMCGGTLEIVPCSHVGHIFRKRSPYSWKTGVNVVKKNCVRLAEVWMDEYKSYYYERFNNDLGDYGDVSARKSLRERLKCKSFDWYIRNIYPELFIPGDAVASGEVRSKYKAQCLDSSVDTHAMNKPIKMWPCHNQGGNQYWMLSSAGEIRRDEGCMDYAGQFIMIYPCHGMKGNQEWIYGPDNTIRHRNTNMCIEISEDGQKVDMKPCTGIQRQLWTWKRKTPKNKSNSQRLR